MKIEVSLQNNFYILRVINTNNIYADFYLQHDHRDYKRIEWTTTKLRQHSPSNVERSVCLMCKTR